MMLSILLALSIIAIVSVIGVFCRVSEVVVKMINVSARIDTIIHRIEMLDMRLNKIDAEVTCIANHYLLKEKEVE